MLTLRSIARPLLALGAAALAAPAAAQPLPTDPALVTGQLDNGLRYIVRRHDNPPGRAVVWVHMHTGSLNETDRQRGIAHYLEHMAFNGSENFAPGTLVPFFQSLGMTFGRDQNAFTNMAETTYQLSLPKADPETLGQGLTFFSDVVGRLSLLPAEVDAERQIIQEERRRGFSGRQRVSDYVQERIAPGSLYAVRDTIGTEATIDAFTPQDFQDYYGTWYGASNATLMVVADADPAAVVRVIGERFGKLPKKARPTPQALNVRAYDKSFAIVASDPEIRSEDVRITRLGPAHPPTTTVAQYRDNLVLRLGESALNRRMSDRIAAGGTAYLSARVSSGDRSNAVHTAEISGRAQPGQWREALGQIALELQRARAFGFTAHELELVKKEMVSSAERAVETEPTLMASAIIGQINGDVGTGEPTMSASQRLELLNAQLPTIKPEEVAMRFAAEYDPRAVAFVATMPAGPAVPTEAQLLEAGLAALAVPPTQESEAVRATTLMAQAPTPGTVTEMTEHAPSRVWSGWLSNNVRVHYRFMDERRSEASVQISLIGGELRETAANKGITSAAQLAWSRPSTRKLSSTDIRDLTAGLKASVRGGGGFGGGGRGGRGGGGGGGGGGDSISLSISGSPEDFEPAFQLAYLLLTEPKIEESAFTQYQTTTKQGLAEALTNPMSLGGRTSGSIIYPESDARTQPLTAANVDALTLAASQAWLEKLIQESPIEVVIVGDIQKDRALDLVARYLGALPGRDRVSAQAYADLRKLQRPAGARIARKTIATPTEQAYVFCGFYGADERNVADARAMSMASRILSTRMVTEVREKAQLVYSIGSSSRAATTYPGFGVFSASAPTEPAKVEALVTKLGSMYEEFAKNGPTEEELAVARRQFATTYEEQMREPGYWSGRLSRLTYRGASLDDVMADPAAYQALTADQVRSTFAKYYSNDSAIVVTVTPTSGGTADAAGGAGGR